MRSSDYSHIVRIPIPEIFCSSETGKPLTQCLMCTRSLLSDGVHYTVEKVIRQFPELNLREVLFEYAMCFDCLISMNESMSSETKQRIQAYISKNRKDAQHHEALHAGKSPDITSRISHCLIKGTPISETREFQMMAQCEGKYIILNEMPLALSLEALEEMNELISEKSRGEMDDFTQKHFSGPPEIAEWLKKRPVIFT